jgi:hypothetical protein
MLFQRFHIDVRGETCKARDISEENCGIDAVTKWSQGFILLSEKGR